MEKYMLNKCDFSKASEYYNLAGLWNVTKKHYLNNRTYFVSKGLGKTIDDAYYEADMQTETLLKRLLQDNIYLNPSCNNNILERLSLLSGVEKGLREGDIVLYKIDDRDAPASLNSILKSIGDDDIHVALYKLNKKYKNLNIYMGTFYNKKRMKLYGAIEYGDNFEECLTKIIKKLVKNIYFLPGERAENMTLNGVLITGKIEDTFEINPTVIKNIESYSEEIFCEDLTIKMNYPEVPDCKKLFYDMINSVKGDYNFDAFFEAYSKLSNVDSTKQHCAQIVYLNGYSPLSLFGTFSTIEEINKYIIFPIIAGENEVEMLDLDYYIKEVKRYQLINVYKNNHRYSKTEIRKILKTFIPDILDEEIEKSDDFKFLVENILYKPTYETFHSEEYKQLFNLGEVIQK